MQMMLLRSTVVDTAVNATVDSGDDADAWLPSQMDDERVSDGKWQIVWRNPEIRRRFRQIGENPQRQVWWQSDGKMWETLVSKFINWKLSLLVLY